jgi:hypothetical protein
MLYQPLNVLQGCHSNYNIDASCSELGFVQIWATGPSWAILATKRYENSMKTAMTTNSAPNLKFVGSDFSRFAGTI